MTVTSWASLSVIMTYLGQLNASKAPGALMLINEDFLEEEGHIMWDTS